MSRPPRRALLLGVALAWACADPGAGDPPLSLTVAVSPTPATVGPGRILLALADSAGSPVPGARVTVTGRPPEGDAAVTDTAVEAAAGRYVAAPFPFDRPGEWILEARALLPDGRSAAAAHPIRVVGPPVR